MSNSTAPKQFNCASLQDFMKVGMVIDPAKRNILTELVDDFTADAAITF